MNTPSEPTSTTPPRRTLFSRMTVVAFVAGVALAGSIAAVASAAGMGACGWHHGMSGHGTEDASAHVDHMLKHLFVEVDATDAQKAQITPLVKQAMADLMPLHAQAQTAHTQAIQALTQATVDRTALEAARVAHLQLADQASKRLVQLIADVDEVLTPAQRSALAAHLQKMHVKT
jgi:Spy/CpxP family protein refolding chaperone